MKKYKYIIAVLAVCCLIVGLAQLSFAADAQPMKFNGKAVEGLSASGSADTITVGASNYEIKSVDTTSKQCGKTYATKKNKRDHLYQ